MNGSCDQICDSSESLVIFLVGMTLVGRYPFQYSSMSLLLVFYLELSMALIVFAYFISTLFSKARVAGTASVLIYVASMVPGYLQLTLQPYGGHGRLLSCLFPPGAATIFSEILLKLELGEVGITWSTLNLGMCVGTVVCNHVCESCVR